MHVLPYLSQKRESFSRAAEYHMSCQVKGFTHSHGAKLLPVGENCLEYLSHQKEPYVKGQGGRERNAVTGEKTSQCAVCVLFHATISSFASFI